MFNYKGSKSEITCILSRDLREVFHLSWLFFSFPFTKIVSAPLNVQDYWFSTTAHCIECFLFCVLELCDGDAVKHFRVVLNFSGIVEKIIDPGMTGSFCSKLVQALCEGFYQCSFTSHWSYLTWKWIGKGTSWIERMTNNRRDTSINHQPNLFVVNRV